jgi:hypothetical protein
MRLAPTPAGLHNWSDAAAARTLGRVSQLFDAAPPSPRLAD